MLVGDGLRVVSLDEPPEPLHDARVRVGDVDATFRCARRLVGVRWAAKAPPVLHPPARPVGLVGLVRAHLGPELLFQAALGFLEALRATAGHRLWVRRALGLQALLGLAQPPATPPA